MTNNVNKVWLEGCSNVKRVKFTCTSTFSGGTPSTTNSKYWDGGTIPWIASGKAQNCIISEPSEYITELGLKNSSAKMIKKNSPVIAMTGATCANVGFLSIDACSNQSIFAYEINDKNFSKFIFYSLIGARDNILLNQQGGAVSGINGDVCKNVYIPDISFENQVKISNYLDKQCLYIDELIAQEEIAIKELNEYKQNLISETILKKDYSRKKMKYLILDLKTGPFGSDLKNSDLKENGVPVFNQRTVLDNNYNSFDAFVSESKFKQLQTCHASYGDILITTRGTIGKISIVKTETIGLIHPCIIRFRLNKNLCLPEYLEYVFNYSNNVIDQINKLSDSTTIEVIYSYNLKEIIISVPPIEKQKEIVNYLNKKCIKIDNLLKLKEEKIELLKSYKKSLIYECVTGKREVPYAN